MTTRTTTSDQRSARDRGAATVTMLALAAVFMAGVFMWLSRTVDRQLEDRPHASAIAYEAARAGAQQIEVGVTGGAAVVDPVRANAAARQSAAAAFASGGDTGVVDTVTVAGDRVTVTVTVTTSGRPATATGTATAHVGFDG